MPYRKHLGAGLLGLGSSAWKHSSMTRTKSRRNQLNFKPMVLADLTVGIRALAGSMTMVPRNLKTGVHIGTTVNALSAPYSESGNAPFRPACAAFILGARPRRVPARCLANSRKDSSRPLPVRVRNRWKSSRLQGGTEAARAMRCRAASTSARMFPGSRSGPTDASCDVFGRNLAFKTILCPPLGIPMLVFPARHSGEGMIEPNVPGRVASLRVGIG